MRYKKKQGIAIQHGIHHTIRRRRVEAGLTQIEVAHVLGITNAGYNRIECGMVSVNTDRLFELATIFGCPIADLITEVPEPVRELQGKVILLEHRLNELEKKFESFNED